MKRTYITKYDRTWKGREWFSSYGSQRFTRRLSDEEAASLDGIELVPDPKPFTQCVGSSDGRMFCTICNSRKGFFVYKMRRGTQRKWYDIYKCAECGEREKKMLYTN